MGRMPKEPKISVLAPCVGRFKFVPGHLRFRLLHCHLLASTVKGCWQQSRIIIRLFFRIGDKNVLAEGV